MENQLPLCLKNISYDKRGSSYFWKGDLVIVQESIYFLPTRDLEMEREQTAKITRHFGGIIMLISMLLTGIVNDHLKKDKSYLNENGLLPAENTDEIQFRQKLDDHLTEIKRGGSGEIFASFNSSNQRTLIRPMRFRTSDVKNIVLKSNTLRFKTSADDYDFKFPRKQATQIRNALFKAQFSV